MRGIKNAQLGIVWCQWKEIYLKVMVHSCRSFGVWAWQIVVVELVSAHKHTHKHLHHPISAANVCPHANTSAQVNRVHLNMYTDCTCKRTCKRLLQRSDVVWLLCIAVIGSALLLHSHPQTITGSQWTTSAREIPTKGARDTEQECVCEWKRERDGGGGGKEVAGRKRMMRR